jgi:chaperonin GroES
MNFKPLGNRVLVKQKEEQNTTSSGIIIPDTSTEKPKIGEIVAISNSVDQIKISDIIVFGKFAGSDYKEDGEMYLIIDSEDVLGIILNKE